MAVIEQYRAWIIAGAVVVLLAVGGGIGWSLNGWRLSGQIADAKTQTADERSAHQADLATISNAAAQQVREALVRQQEAQQAVAGCGSRPVVQPVAATCPKPPEPPAWVMAPAPDLMTPLNGTIGVSETASSKPATR